MAYFSAMGGTGGTGGATLTVTYSEDFYGITITATNGTRTLTKLATSSGSVEFKLPEDGTWTVSATVEGQLYEESVLVDSSYSTKLSALPTGSTATPVNVIKTWLRCAQITDKAYTTLSQVLNDTATLEALVSDSNACDYMARSTNWASGIAADANAMKLIGKFDYCANKLLSNSTWATAIANSTYFESVLNVKVPVMTSNTTPEGEAFASSTSSGAAYRVFDGNDATSWTSNSYGPNTIGYSFTKETIIKKIRFNYSTTRPISSIKIQGSNDNTNWVDITDNITPTSEDTYYTFENSTAYKSYQVVITMRNSQYSIVNTVQFYGRAESTMIPLVPKMTSNTTPSGTCSGTSIGASTVDFYKAFDGDDVTNWFSASGNTVNQRLVYTFPSPVKINRFRTKNSCTNSSYSINLWKNFKIQGSNDGFVNDIHDLYTGIQPQTLQYVQDEVFSNEDSYTSYGILCIDNYGGNQIGYLGSLQFYTDVDYTDNVLFRSAAQDDLYYLDNGSPVIIAHTDNYGYAVVDRDLLPEGVNLTVYSTVAKNPSSLGSAYSRVIHFSKYLTDVYLMPSYVVYWYGYAANMVESNTRGFYIRTYTHQNITYNTNYLYGKNSSSSTYMSICTKDSIDVTNYTTCKIYGSQEYDYTHFGVMPTTANGNLEYIYSGSGGTVRGDFPVSTDAVVSLDISSMTGKADIATLRWANDRWHKIIALWLE